MGPVQNRQYDSNTRSGSWSWSQLHYSQLCLLLRTGSILLILLSFLPTYAFAHGENCFVPTMAIDEPTVGDELDIVFSTLKNREEDGTSHSQGFGMEVSKVIFPHFGISVGTNYKRLRLVDSFNTGFDNVEIGAKYEFYTDHDRNFLLSAGLIAEIGGTGRREIGAHSHTEIAPILYFGKGMADLSDEYQYIRPIVITGLLSPSYCTGARKFENIELGLSFQYHLRNLNHDCHNFFHYDFLNYVIPLVEFPLEMGITGECRGKVLGTVNPGVLFSGHYMQLGFEAMIPVNKRSGSHVGALIQVHFFLDNMFNSL